MANSLVPLHSTSYTRLLLRTSDSLYILRYGSELAYGIYANESLKWAMIGTMGIIFVFLPETPWWLLSKGRREQAKKVLLRYNGHLQNYDVNKVVVSESIYSSC